MTTLYASGSYNADSPTTISAAETQGHVKRLISTVEIPSGQASGTVINFGSLPPDIRLVGSSVLRADVLTGLTSFSLGTDADIDCLMSAVDIHAGGAFSAVAAVNIDSLNDPLWNQQAGVTANPGSRLNIIGTLGAAPTVAGTVTLELIYTTL
jgi:hypothetical protein